MLRELYGHVRETLTADSESESERDGYLSRRAEWHAAAWGVSVAVLYLATTEPMLLTAGIGWILTRVGDPEANPDDLPKELTDEAVYVVGHAAGVILLAELAVWLSGLA